MLFEAIRQMAGMFVMQGIRHLLDGAAVIQHLVRQFLPLLTKPRLGLFAHARLEVPFQRAQGHAASLGERRR